MTPAFLPDSDREQPQIVGHDDMYHVYIHRAAGWRRVTTDWVTWVTASRISASLAPLHSSDPGGQSP